ncbi:MAG: cobalt ECF transporter T component CbiQ [Candidatus Aegiribacteria sp.]|nr:cobalt ECF transporter T component CbiQ [Candidatus Aegiribacteria sp.]
MRVFENWDTSLKIPSMFLLMMSMALIRDQYLISLLPCVAAILFIASGLPLSLLLSRFRAPIVFLLFVSVFLVLFSEGDALVRIGPVVLKSQGAILALNTCVRVLSVITVGIVMIYTTPLSGLSGKLKRMLIPHILVDIGIMTGRYIMVIGEDYNKMKTARKLRGYMPGKSMARRFGVIVPTAATLLIKGFQQSERVFNAMRMRGYGSSAAGEARSYALERPSISSFLMFLATVTVSVLLIVLEVTVETA